MTFFTELFQFAFHHTMGAWDKTLPKAEDLIRTLDTMGRTYTQWGQIELKPAELEYLNEISVKTGIIPATYFKREESRFQRSNTLWDSYNAATYVISHSSTRLKQSGQIKKLDALNVVYQNFLTNREALLQTG
jgi:hypothetical protein